MWSTSNTISNSLGAVYYGAEVKLYLLPFLGSQIEFMTTPAQDNSSIGGIWQLVFGSWPVGVMVDLSNIIC